MVDFKKLGLFVGVPLLAGSLVVYSFSDAIKSRFFTEQNHIEINDGVDFNHNDTKDRRVRFVYPDGSTTYTLDDVLGSETSLEVEVDDGSGKYEITPESAKDKANFEKGFENALISALYDISNKLNNGELEVRFTSNPINSNRNGLVVYNPARDLDVMELGLENGEYTRLERIDYSDSHGGSIKLEREDREASGLPSKLIADEGAWTLFVERLQERAEEVDAERQAKINDLLEQYAPRDSTN